MRTLAPARVIRAGIRLRVIVAGLSELALHPLRVPLPPDDGGIGYGQPQSLLGRSALSLAFALVDQDDPVEHVIPCQG